MESATIAGTNTLLQDAKTQKKKNNLIIAAQYYMNKYMPPLIPRIDVVEVYLDGKDATIEHTCCQGP